MVYICIIKITKMGLTKFLKIVFKRVSTYIKDKVKFLKISFNLSVMRLGLSRKKKPTKVSSKFITMNSLRNPIETYQPHSEYILRETL